MLVFFAASAPAQQYVFRTYRQDEGLNNLTVSALATDRAGFLWVGTENGVYRFLGSSFQRFGVEQGIDERDIQDVYAAPDGTVWVGTYKNLYRWTGERFVPGGPRAIQIWSSGHITGESPGRLLLVDANRLYRLIYGPEGKVLSYEPVLPAAFASAHPSTQHLASLYRNADGRVWVGCLHQICAWKDGTLTEWTKAEGVNQEYWTSILGDSEGNLWAVSGHHVLVLVPGADHFVDRTPPDGDPNSVFLRTPIAVDAQGRVLLSTVLGLARWDGKRWVTIGTGNGLHSNYVTALQFDANGDAWLGSGGHGLYHWVGYNDWEGWTGEQGLPSENIWSTGLFRDGKAYIGTEKGPARIDMQSGAVEKLFSGPKWKYGQVSGMAMDENRVLWTGTFSGSVVRIQPETHAAIEVAKLPALIFNLVQDRSGRIFYPTNDGVFVQANPEAGNKPTQAAEVQAALGRLASVNNGCAVSDGSVWFVADKRIFGFSEGQWRFPVISGFPPQIQSMSDISCSGDGSLWVTGQQAGTWHLTWRDHQLEAKELELPEAYRGLAPLAVLVDHRGWVWLGTDDGLLVWNGSSWRQLTQESGLTWNDVNSSRIATGPDDSVWIGTSGGLGHLIDPKGVFTEVQLPLAMVTEQRGSRKFPPGSEFNVPWSEDDLSFQFATPATLNRSSLRFSYRIAELDPEWTETQDTETQFQAIPPGRYTFEVKASNLARNAQSEVVSVLFRIAPPWWRAPWFFVLCSIFFIWILALLYHLRTRHLMGLKRRLEQLVQERTFELVASREEMRIQATYDSLTGLQNRGAILADLHHEIERSQRERTVLTLVLADIDFFKQVNDTYGHMAGDEALRQFAMALREGIRPYDHAGRYGGEEFLLVMPGIAVSELDERLARLHDCLSNLTVTSGASVFRIHCSLGAIFIDPSEGLIDPDMALAAADRALYEAKQTGRNRVVQHPFVSPQQYG